MRNKIFNENRFLFGYLIIMFILLLFFFYESGMMKVMYIFIITLAAIQIPGSTIIYFIEKKYNNNTILFGLFAGLVSLAFFGYVFGLFGMSFKRSFIVSIGLPYVFLGYLTYKNKIIP